MYVRRAVPWLLLWHIISMFLRPVLMLRLAAGR